MKFQIELPDIDKLAAGLEAEAAAAITGAMREATDGLKGDLRKDILGANFTNNYTYRPGKNRLANSWRGKTFPVGKDSIEAAAYVYSNAPKIIEAFDQGATITASGKKYLAIPTPDAGVRRTSTRNGSQSLNPDAWQRETGVKLRFVPSKSGGVLVADAFYRRQARSYRNRKNFRPISDGGPAAGRSFVVIFVLVKQVKLQKRLNVTETARLWADRVPGLVASRLDIRKG